MKNLAIIAAFFAATCLVTGAQVDSEKKQSKTDTVYVVQFGGISGWGAAKTAAKAREALTKLKDVENVVVDTTARGVIKMKAGKTLTAETVNAALKSMRRVQARSVTKSTVAKAHEVYTVSVKGLGWQDTAVSIREMLEKNAGVIMAFPHGDTGLVHVRVSKADVFDQKSITALIGKSQKFKVQSFKKRVLAKKKMPKPVSKS